VAVVSGNKQWIVTADAGPNALAVLWRASTGQPRRVFKNVPASGVAAADISHDGDLVVLVGKGNEEQRGQVTRD